MLECTDMGFIGLWHNDISSASVSGKVASKKKIFVKMSN